MDHFVFNGFTYYLVLDCFSKFPYIFQVKSTNFISLMDQLIELFALEGTPERIQSHNGPPFSGKKFAELLTKHGIEHVTSSSGYALSTGFIKKQVQVLKQMMLKAKKTHRPVQFAIADLRAAVIDDGLPSPTEILHGRSMTTGHPVSMNYDDVQQRLIQRQLAQEEYFDKGYRVKTQRSLVTGEEVYYFGSNDCVHREGYMQLL